MLNVEKVNKSILDCRKSQQVNFRMPEKSTSKFQITEKRQFTPLIRPTYAPHTPYILKHRFLRGVRHLDVEHLKKYGT